MLSMIASLVFKVSRESDEADLDHIRTVSMLTHESRLAGVLTFCISDRASSVKLSSL